MHAPEVGTDRTDHFKPSQRGSGQKRGPYFAASRATPAPVPPDSGWGFSSCVDRCRKRARRLGKQPSLNDPLVPISTPSPAASFGQPTTETCKRSRRYGGALCPSQTTPKDTSSR